MRPRGWLEFVTSYEFGLDYLIGKGNVVMDELSRRFLCMSVLMVRELDLFEHFRDLCLVCELMQQSARLSILEVNYDFSGEY